MLKHIYTLILGICLLLIICLSGAFDTTIVRAEIDAVSPKSSKIDGLVVYSSPAIADLNNDGLKEIVIGTQAGNLVVKQYNNNGSFTHRWQTNLGASIGSSPAVGDVDGDGDLEIAIGIGWSPTSQTGGIALLDHNGNLLWRKQTLDRNGATGPDGVQDGVFGTPALGDLNNNGRLEVVVAGFDQNIYVLDAQGNDLPGWPYRMLDNTWGSPALADMDNDGHLDIVVGSYGNPIFMPCPDFGCGQMFVMNYQGQPLPGWPIRLDGHIDSSPLIFDLDNDGQLEIAVGTGRNSDFPERFNKLYAFEANGNFMNGWPRPTGGYVFASPAAADIDNDGDYEIFVGAADGKMYGWSHTGQTLPGWPVTPLNQNGAVQGIAGAITPTIVDADGDGQLEIFTPTGWDIVGFETSGAPLSDSYRFRTQYSIGATPAWGDIDNDGKLEMVNANGHVSDVNEGFGRINVWDLDTEETDDGLAWPMWRKNVQRTGADELPPSLSVSTSSLLTLSQTDSRSDIFFFFNISNTGSGTISYAITDNASNVSVFPASGDIDNNKQEITVTLDTTSLNTPGTYKYDLTIAAEDEQGNPLPGSPTTLPITIVVTDEIFHNFLPTLLSQ